MEEFTGRRLITGGEGVLSVSKLVGEGGPRPKALGDYELEQVVELLVRALHVDVEGRARAVAGCGS
jgi:hypothetical protein